MDVRQIYISRYKSIDCSSQTFNKIFRFFFFSFLSLLFSSRELQRYRRKVGKINKCFTLLIIIFNIEIHEKKFTSYFVFDLLEIIQVEEGKLNLQCKEFFSSFLFYFIFYDNLLNSESSSIKRCQRSVGSEHVLSHNSNAEDLIS